MVNAHAVLDIILMETLAHLVAPYVLSALAQAAMLAWEMLVMLVELVNAVMDSLHQEINAWAVMVFARSVADLQLAAQIAKQIQL
jgi:hypothetical protein